MVWIFQTSLERFALLFVRCSRESAAEFIRLITRAYNRYVATDFRNSRKMIRETTFLLFTIIFEINLVIFCCDRRNCYSGEQTTL